MTSDLFEEYQTAKNQLFDSLAVLDTYIAGIHKPQTLSPKEWTEIATAPGVWIKPIMLHQPAHFALALVHGYKGAFDSCNKVADNVEIHCIMGKLALNGLEIKAGDRINIPANIEYNFKYLEDSYLTAKFTPIIPQTLTNFSKNGCAIPTENSTTTPEA